MDIPDDTRRAVSQVFTDSTKDRNVAGRKTYFEGLTEIKEVVKGMMVKYNWAGATKHPAIVLKELDERIQIMYADDK